VAHQFPNPKVAIVGAGVAGLFTAMILDYLTDNVTGFNVTYDIYEAHKDSSRLRGRLYTFNFSDMDPNDPKHNYFDIGAMCFLDATPDI
jgi:protoporphyrinogen oxidase